MVIIRFLPKIDQKWPILKVPEVIEGHFWARIPTMKLKKFFRNFQFNRRDPILGYFGHIFAIFDHFPSILVSLYAFIHDLYVSQSEKNEFREYKSDKSSVLINKQKTFVLFRS